MMRDSQKAASLKIRLGEYKSCIRPGSTDMRKGATGLACLVQYEMGL